MAVSTTVKHFTDGSITLKDGAGTPRSLAIPFTQGDLQLQGMTKEQREVHAYQTRGTLHTVRLGARTFFTGSFTAMVADYFHAATDETLLTFLLDGGASSANVTSLTSGDVYVLDLVWTVEGTNHGDAADHVHTVTEAHCTFDIGEGEPNTISVSFTSYGTYTVTSDV